ncbi:MAG: hypothetical protein WKF30_18525, partial [Pyrinomonadaceae bacterium]
KALQTVAKTIPMIAPRGDSTYAAMPTFANPWRWRAIVDTSEATHRFDLNLWAPDETPEKSGVTRFIKPIGKEASAADIAAQDARAQAFLEFSRFPATRVQFDCAKATVVQFADLRYTEPGSRNDNFSVQVVVNE